MFCFKQKTAYDMRMSDWSSDVCSSDLELLGHLGVVRPCATLGGALVRRAAVQPAFEYRVAEIGVEWPGQAGGGEPIEHALHGGAHHAQTTRDEAQIGRAHV